MRAVGAVGLGCQESTTSAHTVRQIVQHINGHLPVDAGIGDADTAEESGGALGGNLLVTLVDVGFDHDTDDTGLTLAELIGDLLGDQGLVEVVLLGVAVRAVHHENFALLLGAEGLPRTANALAVVVSTSVSATEDDKAVLVTGGLGDGRQTLLGHTEEAVGVSGRTNGINSHGQVAICAVLVTNGEGKTGSQLSVKLGLGGAGTDGPEGDEISKELRGDGVEHLRGNGETGAGEVYVELAGDTQTLVDVVSLVDIGVVDQTLPADGGAGLLEICAHDDAEVFGELASDFFQTTGVFKGRVGVMDGAGTDHDEQTVVTLLDDLNGFIATLANSLNGTFRL